MSELTAYVDGSSHGNPGPAGIGVIVTDASGRTVGVVAKWIGHQDNNVAEYIALLEALQCAVALGARSLRVFSDSLVVVKQMNGEYSPRRAPYYSLHWTCRKLARSLPDFTITHVRREHNSEANRLANQAVRSRRGSAVLEYSAV
jgi:ribonuclease HI